MADPTMDAVRAKDAARVEAVRLKHDGISGHAWLTDPWARSCIRCGLIVRSLAYVGLRVEHPEVGACLVFDAVDTPTPPCLDGDVGAYATLGKVAPWKHT